MLQNAIIDEKKLQDLNSRIIQRETSNLTDKEGVGYMLNAIIEVLPPRVKSVSFQGVTVSRQGTENWTFKMAISYITKNCL